MVPAGANSFSECLRMGTEVFHALKKSLGSKGLSTAVGDEGVSPPTSPPMRRRSRRCSPALRRPAMSPDRMSSSPSTPPPARSSKAVLRARARGRSLSSEEMVDYWADACSRFPILSIEDGMAENDWDGWKLLTERLGDRVQLVGDDLFVTNPERLSEGIEKGVGNSILVKVNQIGTLTETLEAIAIARKAGYTAVISHRSGETEDTTIADLAVATARDRSRRARRRARIESPSTTGCCESRRILELTLGFPACRPSYNGRPSEGMRRSAAKDGAWQQARTRGKGLFPDPNAARLPAAPPLGAVPAGSAGTESAVSRSPWSSPPSSTRT